MVHGFIQFAQDQLIQTEAFGPCLFPECRVEVIRHSTNRVLDRGRNYG